MKKAFPCFSLQSRNLDELQESILYRYECMYRDFHEDIKLLSKDQFCEVEFSNLVSSPLIALEKIYATLLIDKFNQARHGFEQFLDSVKDYNEPAEIPITAETRSLIEQRWRRYR